MQLRSRITLAAAFFLLAPAVLFFLIDLMRDRFIASSFVERQYLDDKPFVAGFEREARLRLEAPSAELAQILPATDPPIEISNGPQGKTYEPWTTMQWKMDAIAAKHPGLSFGLFDREGTLLVSVGPNVDLLGEGYDGKNSKDTYGASMKQGAYAVRRSIRYPGQQFVYVGLIPMQDFIDNISNALGEPVALVHRETAEVLVTRPNQIPATDILSVQVALPTATDSDTERFQRSREFWESVSSEALMPMSRRYFTISTEDHRGVVTEMRLKALEPVEQEGFFLRLVRNRTQAAIREERQNRLVYGGFTVLILVSVVLLLWFFNRSFRPLTDLIEALRALTRHDFEYRIPHTQRADELGALARGLTDFRESLVDRERLVSLKEQMEFAAQIQRSILPHEFRVGEGISIDALTEPAEDVGGDFFDIFELREGKAGIVVADVADKGMGSALFGALTSSLVRANARLYSDPHRVLELVNRQLSERNEANLFVTLFYGVVDCATGEIRYCNAGHEPPLLMHRDGEGKLQIERTPTTKGLPLGLVEEAEFESGTIQMQPNDDLVLFTDGVTEAANEDAKVYSGLELNNLLLRQKSTDPRDIIRNIMRGVESFAGEQPQTDDITLMVVRYDGLTAKPETSQDGEEVKPGFRVISNT